jgi:phosphate-selective porin
MMTTQTTRMAPPSKSHRPPSRATWTLCALGVLASGGVARAQEPAPAAPAPAPVELAPAPAAPPPVVPPAPASAAPAADEPIAGWSNGTAFLKSPDDSFVLLPSGRLQIDGYYFKTDGKNPAPPRNTWLLKRARLELAGWIGPAVYFQIGADFAGSTPNIGASPAAQSNLATTDNFVALAPWGDAAILQIGQYDAPFTLENRTSDKYFDFMERSVTVRAFGIPSNKEQGAMLHGTNAARNYYYSLALLNGDGQNFKNVDNNFDWMGRAWVAPLSFGGPAMLHDVTVGGSFWTGNRTLANGLGAQATQSGYTFLDTKVAWKDAAIKTPVELHQQGRLNAFALELNAPIDHKLGVRFELVHKKQPLSVVDVTAATKPAILGGAELKGTSWYAEAWYWAMGDDRIIGEPGMQLPSRLKKFGVKAPQRGLMLAARLEMLDEDVTLETDAAALGVKSGSFGKTKLTSMTLGANYWISKRFRTTVNYVLNHFGGDTSFAAGLASKNEQELLLHLGIAL